MASGVLSMSRMVGGTFGVAAIGALFQHLARNDLESSLAGVGAAERDRIVENLGSGADVGLSPEAASAAHDAFIHALSSGMWLSAAVSATGAVVAFFLISPKLAPRPDPARRPDAAAEVAGA